jgi:uncharacterized protein YbgA (DUF1722 family)/uncharacterized protein YbbK (DUF523 family)
MDARHHLESFPRPRVLVSKCLGFARCRYNGETINDPFTDRLKPWVEFTPVCPEMQIGLGVPRDPVRLVEGQGRVRMVQPASGRDLTSQMVAFVSGLADSLASYDGLLLKSRSPSCGPMDVKIYSDSKPGSASRRGRGLFAEAVLGQKPGLAVEHEGRVLNLHLREHFLSRVFTMARMRLLVARPNLKALMEFHAANKLLLMAYHQDLMRRMGRLLANHGHLPVEQVAVQYKDLLGAALTRAPKSPSVINVCMHAFGYFKKGLTPGEKEYFLGLLEQYRQGRIPLLVLQSLLTAWALKYEEGYLLGQSFFNPYPRELFDLADSGKGTQP